MLSLLRTEDITIRFGGLTAVKDFRLNLKEREIVGLIGPNGAGKTTVFNMLTGIYRPTAGRIFFRDREITGKRPDRITACGMARTFQNIRLLPSLNVLDNVLLGRHVRLKSTLFEAVLGLPRYRREERQMIGDAMKLLESVDMSHLADEQATGLPYGRQRRLEIVRAMATKPSILLLDEPAAGMNPQETEDLMRFITRLRDDFGFTILLIEHDMKVVMGICDRVIVLDYGITIAEGSPAEIRNNPKVIEAYLGTDDA